MFLSTSRWLSRTMEGCRLGMLDAWLIGLKMLKVDLTHGNVKSNRFIGMQYKA